MPIGATFLTDTVDTDAPCRCTTGTEDRTLLMSGEIHVKVSVDQRPAVASGVKLPSAASSAGTPTNGCNISALRVYV